MQVKRHALGCLVRQVVRGSSSARQIRSRPARGRRMTARRGFWTLRRLLPKWCAHPRCNTAGVSATQPPETDVARVARWCRERVPEAALHQVRVECEVAPTSVTIVERRAPWREDLGPEWTRLPVARLRYPRTTGEWSLHCRDRNLRFHRYDRVRPTARVEELLAEIDRDPTGIFWG